MQVGGEKVTDDLRWLRRLRWVGMALPVLSIIALQLLRPVLHDLLGARVADQLVAVLSIVGALCFGVVMFGFIERGHQLVLRREDLLLRTRHQADLEHERHEALLAERERIAREMHDSLAQVLATAHLRLRGAQASPEAGPALRAELGDLAEMCDDTYRDVRETIFGLREAARTDRSLVEVLDDYVSRFARTSGVPAEVQVDPDLEFDLAPEAQVHIVRIVQEALTNVRKHAQARGVAVRLASRGGALSLTVSDWLIYGAYLHARVVADWRGKRSAWLLIVAFGAILFTFLGNHFFTGMHSYV